MTTPLSITGADAGEFSIQSQPGSNTISAGSSTTFVVRFAPETGMIRFIEAMRYRDAVDKAKILWINEARVWRKINGETTMAVGAITWFDQGTPWAVFTVEELVYNADVSQYIRAAGP